MVPSFITQIVKRGRKASWELDTLKDILVAGSPLSIEIARVFMNMFNVSLRQAFGSSEMGWSTLRPIFADPRLFIETSGIPINGFTLKIIDQVTAEPLEANLPGEVCVKGPQMSRCYLNNPKANIENFEGDYFKTGDIGHYDKNGYLYIIDRLKEVIKYQGFQVTPAEIESILISHQAVKEAIVVGAPDEIDGERPKAYVVLKENASIGPEELIDFVRNLVAPYKQLTGGLQFLKSFPRTVIGKIDRKYLKSLP